MLYLNLYQWRQLRDAIHDLCLDPKEIDAMAKAYFNWQ